MIKDLCSAQSFYHWPIYYSVSTVKSSTVLLSRHATTIQLTNVCYQPNVPVFYTHKHSFKELLGLKKSK